MPPEALSAKPKYITNVDVYSYGVLIIHTLCGRWPFPEDAFRLDPQNPDTMIPITEVERRAEYLQEIGNDHPLMAVIRQCLSNAPARRPETPVLLDRVNTVLSALPQPFTNRVEMLQQFETEIKSMQSDFDAMESEIDSKQSEIDSKQSEIDSMQSEIDSLTRIIESLKAEVAHRQQSQPSHTSQPDIQNEVHSEAEVVKQSIPTYTAHIIVPNFCVYMR